MFSTHNLHNPKPKIRPACHPTSEKKLGRNLVMLFLSIVFGFGAVSVLANLSIQTNIQNARQTIMRVTITDDGTDGGNLLLDFNTGSRIFISDAILDPQTSFSGKVLGLDANNKIIYVPASGLIISGSTSSNGGNGDAYWTGTVGSSIVNINTGSVYVGGNPVDTTKFYVKSTGNTQAIFEETNPSNAANIRLKNTVNSWRLGGFSDRFYVGVNTTPILTINSGGSIGINVRDPQYTLHIKNPNGNAGVFIGGTGNQSTIRLGSVLSDRRNLWEIKDQFSDGSLIWSRNNGGNRYSSILMESGGNVGIKINAGDSVKAALQVSGTFIAGDYSNTVVGIYSSIGGGIGNYISGNASFIGAGGRTKLVANQIYGNDSFIGGGEGNVITGNYGMIGGGETNKIDNSNVGSIAGGTRNYMLGGAYNFIGGGGYNYITGGTNNNNNTVGGGLNNKIINDSNYSSILGGRDNLISGSDYSFVGGRKAYALHDNSFVRNTDTSNIFQTTKRNTFIINAPYGDDAQNGGTMGGVGINTASPAASLDVNGSILSNSSIAGSSITATYGMTAKSFKVSSQSTGVICDNGTRGTIIMSGNNFYGCSNNTWKQLDN